MISGLGLPEDNKHTSRVHVFLGAILLWLSFGDAPALLLYPRGHGLQGR
jgi:hypothetical protein